jgi:hypothetical protein
VTNRTPEHLTLYEITKDCPCDKCDQKPDCVIECRTFNDYVQGPNWRQVQKQNLSRKIQRRALAALRRAEA